MAAQLTLRIGLLRTDTDNWPGFILFMIGVVLWSVKEAVWLRTASLIVGALGLLLSIRFYRIFTATGEARNSVKTGGRQTDLVGGSGARWRIPGGITFAIVTTNIGLLISLLFSPNLGHANPALSGVGFAVLAVGLALLAIGAYRRRHDTATPAVKR